jgi:hypothetical protein
VLRNPLSVGQVNYAWGAENSLMGSPFPAGLYQPLTRQMLNFDEAAATFDTVHRVDFGMPATCPVGG